MNKEKMKTIRNLKVGEKFTTRINYGSFDFEIKEVFNSKIAGKVFYCRKLDTLGGDIMDFVIEKYFDQYTQYVSEYCQEKKFCSCCGNRI